MFETVRWSSLPAFGISATWMLAASRLPQLMVVQPLLFLPLTNPPRLVPTSLTRRRNGPGLPGTGGGVLGLRGGPTWDVTKGAPPREEGESAPIAALPACSIDKD